LIHLRFLFLCVLLSFPSLALGLDIPPSPSSYISDWAGLLSAQMTQNLNKTLWEYEKNTGHQVIVATFPSLEEESLEDFSIRLAAQWKIGNKKADDGVILLIFKNERKIRIEVGYGMEAYLTDALSSTIIRESITPAFIKGDYDEGVKLGVLGILSSLSEAIPQKQQKKTPIRNIPILPILIIIAIILMIDLGRYGLYAHKLKTYDARYNFWEWFIKLAFLFFILQIIFRILIHMAASSRGGYHGSHSGFGGGGFGGGGGGSFGGGGSSGGW